MQNLTRMCSNKWVSEAIDSHIVVPAQNVFDDSERNAQLTGKTTTIEATLNINSASVVELANKLPGIGMLKAQRIVEWRRSNGLFEYKDQLLEIPGIGVKTLERIQSYFHLGETPSAMLDAPFNKTVNEKAPVLTDIVRGAIADAERSRTLPQGG